MARGKRSTIAKQIHQPVRVSPDERMQRWQTPRWGDHVGSCKRRPSLGLYSSSRVQEPPYYATRLAESQPHHQFHQRIYPVDQYTEPCLARIITEAWTWQGRQRYDVPPDLETVIETDILTLIRKTRGNDEDA